MNIRPVVVSALALLLLASTALAEGERQTTESGLVWTLLTPGDGDLPQPGDRVTLHYEARLADGTVFGTTRDGRPFSADVTRDWLIPGLFEGIQLVRPGAKARFEIPAALAFGVGGKPSREDGKPPVVPPDTDVVYEVEVISVEHGPVLPTINADDWVEVEPGLRYAIVSAGSGAPPKPTQRVRVRYAIWNEVKSPVASTFSDGTLLDGQLAKLRFVTADGRPGEPFLPTVVSKMQPGSVVFVEADGAHTWGAKPPLPELAPNAKSYWLLELVEVSEVPSFDDIDEDAERITLPSGLSYVKLREGDGRKANPGREHEIQYVGFLANGEPFDSSFQRGGTFRTKLDRVIEGWKEGIPLMREGDVYAFTIPPSLAYGSSGSPPAIGPNETLVFWVELQKVR